MKKYLIIFSLFFMSCISHSNEKINVQDTITQSKNVQQKASLKEEMRDSSFLSYWQEFKHVVKTGELSRFKKVSIDTLECENITIYIDEFINKHFSQVFDEGLLAMLKNDETLDFVNAAMEPTYFSSFVKQQIKNANYIIKEVNITQGQYPDILITTLKFIETDKGYKFYGYDRVGG